MLDTQGIPVICWMEVLAQSIHGTLGVQGGTRKKVLVKKISSFNCTDRLGGKTQMERLDPNFLVLIVEYQS